MVPTEFTPLNPHMTDHRWDTDQQRHHTLDYLILNTNLHIISLRITMLVANQML